MKKQQGFTRMELVIVVIILGFLAVAAVPRFIDATADAKDASVDGVAGGFASAVGLARAQWELVGRPAVANAINYDGQSVYLGDTGYPTSTLAATAHTAMTAGACASLLTGILASSPTVASTGTNAATSDYVTSVTEDNTDGDKCNFFLVSTLTISGANVTVPGNTTDADTGHQGFVYNAKSSQVTVFKN
jgi:MSHA pilin protein MshB